MRKGKFVGLVHKTGEYNGKAYSFYQAFFAVDAPSDSIGVNIITCRCDDLFPDLNKENINKEFELFDYFNNNRLGLAGCRVLN